MHGSHGDAPMNDRHVQTECSEWSLWPLPGGSLEPALECQSKKKKKAHYGPNCPTKAELPGLYLAGPAAMTQTSKPMMEVKHQNTEESKGQQHARVGSERGTGSVTIEPQTPPPPGVGLEANKKQQVAGLDFCLCLTWKTCSLRNA